MSTKVQPNYGNYIYNVLKQVHPEIGLSSGVRFTINEIVKDLIKDTTDCANKLVILVKRKTITSWGVQAAINIMFPNELGLRASRVARSAVTRYNASVSGQDEGGRLGLAMIRHTSTAARAQLTFSPSRVRALMRSHVSSKGRIGRDAPVYLAAVVQYIVSQLLEHAGAQTKAGKRIRITNRDVTLSISKNPEVITRVNNNEYVLGGGVPTKPKADVAGK